MKKANKKKRNNRIKSLVLLLFLTIVMLSTATYAWFTSNRTVSITTINVNVAATSGLQISADAVTWKSVLSNSDLSGASFEGVDNHIVSEMSPVSTAGTVTSGLLKMYSGTVEGDSGGNMALTTTALTDSSGKYVVFDIFLKVDTGGTVYLQAGSGATVKSGETSKGLENAARYAFVVEGNGSATANASTLQGYMNGTSSTLTIIEPNYDTHTATGIQNATTYYGFASGAITQTGASPVNYYGVDAAVSNVALTSTNPPGLSATNTNFNQKWGTIFKTNTAFSTAATGFGYISGTGTSATVNHYPALLSLSSGVTKVRVYMWVEGQDIDCENNASGTNLSYTIMLTLDDYNSTP